MQKIKPQYNFNQLYPVLEVNDECIISKSGDITIAYQLQLPPTNSLEKERYADIRLLLSRAYQTLPIGTIILKQDIYFKKKYTGSEGNQPFLLQKYSEHFDGREYMDFQSYLYFCMPHKARRDISAKMSTLCSKLILPGKTSPEAIKSFRQQVEQAVAIICADSAILGASKLSACECDSLISSIVNFSYQEE
ncbi:MAG: DUF3875 domain-containing protein, partial [Bacteroidales bacterium]|nr:DUF3875 domain-containing protein [Bacteroidales bacterium]